MKKYFAIFLLIFFITCLKSQVKEGFVVPPHPKIGLSLSGGGAKGFAHVGVLKVLDSLGIKIDYISGTSMGAVVGGLYASGYTGKDIEKIILDTDFYTVLSNEKNRQVKSFFNKSTDKYLLTVPIKNGKINIIPKAISTGQKNIYLLKELFKNVSNVDDFSKLPIPFMCVATNLESGKMKVFEKGDLTNSIMASTAFPSLIDPVKIGDSLYIDGAMTLNFPSKILKNKGIDIVIGVDLSQGLAKRDKIQSAVDILNQVVDFGIQNETKNQYQYTDINIHPNLSGMTATSYGDKEKILDSGFVEAKKYTKILSLLPKREGSILRASVNPVFSNVYKIDNIKVENSNIFNKSFIQGKMGLKLPSLQTYGNINKMIDKIYATDDFKLINYDIVQIDNKNILKINVDEDDTRFFLKFGLHYDEIFNTGLLINTTIRRLLFKNSTISFDGILGDKPRFYFNYFIDNGYIPGFGLYASGMSIELRDKSGDLTDKWAWFRNEVFIQSIWKDKFAVGGGISHDYYESRLSNKNIGTGAINYINPYFFIKSDTQNDKEFPTKGLFINIEGKLIDFFYNRFNDKTIQSKANIYLNFPISKTLTYRLNLFGGLSIGKNVNTFYKYRLGGLFEQNLGNFEQFSGFYLGQTASDNLLIASNNLQINIHKNYYLTGNFSVANPFNKIEINEILKSWKSSAGLTAGYKSPFGQIKLNYSVELNNGRGILNVILGHWF